MFRVLLGKSIGPASVAVAAALLFAGFTVVERSHQLPDRPLAGAAPGYGVPLPAQTRHFSAPDIRLVDDAAGQPLFNAGGLAPGSRVQDCVAVTYTGTARQAQLTLAVKASGALAPALITTIEAGSGGAFHHCAGFVSRRQVFTGPLSTLPDGVSSPKPLGLVTAPKGAATTFRFTFVVGDDGAVQGATAGADFYWSARV